MPDKPRLLTDNSLAQALEVMRQSFAYMDGVIDPPSSIHRLDIAALRATSKTAEIWGIGDPVIACVVLTPKDDALYVGKLAVAADARKLGYARALIDHAVIRAQALDKPALELQVRIELTDNQIAFGKMGFVETARTAHAGYDRPTSVTMRRMIPLG